MRAAPQNADVYLKEAAIFLMLLRSRIKSRRFLKHMINNKGKEIVTRVKHQS